jgi:allantoin racemase
MSGVTERCRIVYQLIAPMERTLGLAEIERRREYLQRHADAKIEIEVKSAASGYASIESERDAVTVAPRVMAGLQLAEAEGASAGIVGCFPIRRSMPSARR